MNNKAVSLKFFGHLFFLFLQTMEDFEILKVLGKGTFGKVSTMWVWSH